MKNPRFTPVTAFLTGTTLAFMFAFGLLLFTGGKLPDSVSEAGKQLLPEALAGFDTNQINGDYFNSQTWTHSTTLKATDTMAQTLYKLTRVYNTQSYFTLTDINGDGLIDLLYHDYQTNKGNLFGVYLNNGNLSFTWAYKCVWAPDGSYYGDCAG